uniref:Uncharacterized protein n=1 Tax=Oryza sativa subsp. japonica TaxID=39947 RepID=Q8LI21_ORYSJ|nr:hypothetical protein [Oryza sativa Japonica Group]
MAMAAPARDDEEPQDGYYSIVYELHAPGDDEWLLRHLWREAHPMAQAGGEAGAPVLGRMMAAMRSLQRWWRRVHPQVVLRGLTALGVATMVLTFLILKDIEGYFDFLSIRYPFALPSFFLRYERVMHDFVVAGGITVLTPFIWGALVAIMLDGRPVVPEPEQQVHQPDPDEPEHVYRVVLHGEEFTFLTNIPRAKFYLLIAAVFVVVFLFHPFSAET